VLALGVVLAVADGQATHTATVKPLALGLPVNALHLLATGLWAGTLVGTLVLWRVPGLARQHPAILRRTRLPVGGALLTLVATGTLMALQHLVALDDLVALPYGQALAVKLATIVVTLALGILAARSRSPRTWQRWELVGLMMVLVLAGVLVSLPPRR
jgi:copper transport protein